MNFPKCNPDALPDHLKQQALFCCWRYEERNGKTTKVPYNPQTGNRAKSTDPDTFSTWAQAIHPEGSGYDGLGVGLFGSLAAIDIDHCIEGGQLSPLAADIVGIMDSYTERSPSGEGLRIFFTADLQGMTKAEYEKRWYFKSSPKAPGLELYIAGMTSRYVTATGDTIRTADIADRTEQARQVLDKYMQRPRQEQAHTPAPAPLSLSDAELIEKARAAKNGSAFAALWNGDISGYPSHSEADQALCSLLAFWTAGDEGRIDQLFRQSGLMREKWAKREQYRRQTIERAISGCKEYYTPPQPVQMPPAATEPEAPPPPPKRSPVELFDLFMDKIQSEAYRPIKTGMPALDNLLSGGFSPQSLVMIGAAPGMGKTTLAQQIFETMAKDGTEVIFLNLEMSREQLLARSISRAAAKAGKRIDALEVMRGYTWTPERRQTVTEAAQTYRRTIAPRMQYNPDGTGATVGAVKECLATALEEAKAAGKPAPVIVLDYLQLIQAEQRQDIQEAIKAALKVMKDYAIKGNTIACAILAFNRDANKGGKATMESGRDTSSIEYSADTMLALNYAALEDGTKSVDEIDKMKVKPKEVLLKLLKQRMGASGGKLELDFDREASTFIPVDRHHSTPAGWAEIKDTDDLPDGW